MHRRLGSWGGHRREWRPSHRELAKPDLCEQARRMHRPSGAPGATSEAMGGAVQVPNACSAEGGLLIEAG
eukprot:7648641-Alexandrium_andersonii.AAC.1